MPRHRYHQLGDILRRALQDRSGGVAILFALAMPVLIGFAALATEVGVWYLQRRTLQTVADVAAMSAAYEILAATGEETSAALQEAERHGVTSGPRIEILVNTPPTFGAFAGDANAVEIQIQEQRVLLFAGLFSSETVAIASRAVARVNPDGLACILALDPTAYRAVDVAGTANLSMEGCMLAANSDNSEAVAIRGNAEVSALALVTSGDYSVSGSGELVTTRPPITGAPPLPDPYAGRPVPTGGSCSHTGFSYTNGTLLQLLPGTFCDGMSIGGQSQVNLAPGEYVVRGGSLSINAGATITCSDCTGGRGVTFVLTGSGSNYAMVKINGDANIKLNAPTTGSLAGLLFYQDPTAPRSGENVFNGGAEMNLEGALYFPSQAVAFRGNSSAGSSAGCTQIVARMVGFTGTSNLGSNCTDTGTETIDAGGAVALVE